MGRSIATPTAPTAASAERGARSIEHPQPTARYDDAVDPDQARRVVAETIAAEWEDEDVARLTVSRVELVQRVRVDEAIGREDERAPRSTRIEHGDPRFVAALSDRPMATAPTREIGYRGGPEEIANVPAQLADRAREVLDDWRAHMTDPDRLRVRIALEEEEVAEVRVKGTRRTYWVGLRSKRVLGRIDRNLGMGRALRIGAALAAALVLPPVVLGLSFGPGGVAFGLLFGFWVLLGLAVFFGAQKGGVIWSSK